MSNHLFDGLLGHAEPDATLAKLIDGRSHTYGDALDASARMANTLQALGVKKGDRVAVQVKKSIQAIFLYLGCVRLGAVFLPLNTAYTPAEVSYFLENATPALFICDPNALDQMRDVAETQNIHVETMGVPGLKDADGGSLIRLVDQAAGNFENAECDADDIAAILYTSGTTGRSKGAMLSHDNLLSNAITLTEQWQFTNKDVLLHALPIFHTHGLFVATNIALVSGASMIFLAAFDQDTVIEQLPNATTMMGVPTFYTRLLGDDRFSKKLVEHMRLFVSGSAPLLAETHVAFEKLTGQRILERYGMTETNMNTTNPYDGERRAGTVGFPLRGVQVRICDPDTGKELSPNEIGVLEVNGPNVFQGYWKMPEKTAEEFRDDGFFITGDLARQDDDGYIHIVGRSKDLIISGGYNIYPKEIELLLDDEEGVLESAVIGVPHADFGEGVLAVVVATSPNFNAVTALENLKPKLARFKQPKRLEVVDELPRNTMGKVQKNVLREKYKDAFS